MSKALRRLRDEFADPLVVRGPNGIVPPPRAHAFVRVARPHLAKLHANLLRAERFDPAVTMRPITLAFPISLRGS